MAPSISIESVISDLKSDKIKTREQGVADLKSYLSDQTHLRSAIDKGEGDPKYWLGIYQALFACVVEERKIVIKKGVDKSTPMVIHRLTRAASAVRWLIQLTSPHLSRRVVKAIFAHLTQSLESKGSLFAPITLDYVKSLKAIFSYPAHLDGLDARDWEGLVRMCFAGIYGEDLEQFGSLGRFTEGEANGEDWILAGGSGGGAKSHGRSLVGASGKGKGRMQVEDMEVDELDEDQDEEDESELASSIQKKRKRGLTRGLLESQQPSTSTSTHQRSQSHPPNSPNKLTTSLSQIALISLVHTLLQSAHCSPLLGSTLCPPYNSEGEPTPFPPSYAAPSILYKLLRFLHTFPSETSAHLDVLRSINLVLGEVQLNQLQVMREVGPKLTRLLAGLWNKTRSKEVKEQVVIGWKLVLPFLVEKRKEHGEGEEAEVLERLLEALEGVEGEVTRGGEVLALESLRLKVEGEGVGRAAGRRKAFVAGSFKFGQPFSPSQAMIWATLELHADVVSAMSTHAEGLPYASTSSVSSPIATKRRKVENPITALLHSINTALNAPSEVARLQILLFLIDRHWKDIRNYLNPILDTLNSSLNWEDPTVQSWALLCLASISTEDRPFRSTEDPSPSSSSNSVASGSGLPSRSPFASPSRKAARPSSDNSLWEKAWTFAVRKIVIPAVCRAACHAAHAIVVAEKVAPLVVLTDVESLVKDIEIQGPYFPYDSVCDFLATCLEMASRDVRLFRMELEEKVVNWLGTSWRVVDGTTKGFNVRSKLENHTPTDVLRLLSSLCRFPKHVVLVHTDFLPESPIVSHVVQEAESAVVRDYIIHAHLDLPNTSRASSPPTSSPPGSIPGPNDNLVKLDGCARKISTFLSNSVASLLAEWTDVDLEATVTPEKVRRTLDLVVLVLSFEAVLELNGIAPERKTVKAACSLLSAIANSFSLSRLSGGELAVMVQGLEPLVGGSKVEEEEGAGSRALLRPGPMTGIRKDMLPRFLDRRIAMLEEEQERRLTLQHIVWKSSDLQDAFVPLLDVLKNVLRLAIGAKVEEQDQGREVSMDVDSDDEFGPMRIVEDEPSSSQSSPSQSSHSSDASKNLVSTLLACITRVSVLQTASRDPSRNKDVFDQLLLECDGPQFLTLGSAIFEAVQVGQLHISKMTAGEIAQAFDEWFESYRFTRDESMHLLAISFLRSSISVWTAPSMGNSDEGQIIRSLFLQLTRELDTGKMRSPRVRVEFLRFVEAYFRADPAEEFWKSGPSPRKGEEIGSLVALVTAVTRDLHVLVRFEAAVVYPNLFNFVDSLVQKAVSHYGSGQKEFGAPVGVEHGLTASLLWANVLIVSTTLRKQSYWNILERMHWVPETSLLHLQASLDAAATSIGFETLFKLWEAYSSSVLTRFVKNHSQQLQNPVIPPSLLGYATTKQNAEMLLRRFGCMDLLLVSGEAGEDRVADICRFSQRSVEEARQECLPRSLAIRLSTIFNDEAVDESKVVQLLAKGIPGIAEGSMLRDVVDLHLDAIVAALLAQLLDPSPESVEAALLQLEDGRRKADVYKAMWQPLPSLFSVVALIPPRGHVASLIKAHQWILRQPGAEDYSIESVVFNALHELASCAGRSALVVEQIRFTNSIALLVSLYYPYVQQSSLLPTFLHLSIVLMTQVDLAPVARGLLRWALDQCQALANPPKGISQIFVRISHLAHSFLDRTHSEIIQKLGEDLLLQIEQVSEKTARKSSSWRNEVRTALLLWPRALKEELAELCAETKATDLVKVLSKSTASSATFSLVKRYRDLLPEMEPKERSQFAKSSLWHLKSALPSKEELAHRPEEMEAFMDLLYLVDGDLPAPSLPTLISLSTADTLLGPMAVEQKDLSRESATKYFVSVGLGDLLGSGDIEVINLAFETLRLLRSIPGSFFLLAQTPSAIKERLSSIGQSSASLAKPSSARNLKDISKIAPASSHDQWLVKIAPFLAEVLAREDPFFAQLSSVFASSSDFTQRLLPHLVHAVLRLPQPQTGSTTQTPKAILSAYFQSLLRNPSSTTVIKRAVIDVVLHLRHLQPDGSVRDALAYEKWLEIDYLLLSEAAVECRAYTTALLFLELRGRTDASDEMEDVSQLLYEIYSNIEDPDGFYGVTSNDVRSSLVRRLHHENQWDRAFRFHGASFQNESGGGDSRSNAVGNVLESLHSFGFDKMAMSFLQGSRSSKGGDEDVPQGLSYDLAWRTDSWDVPAEPLTSGVVPQGSSLFSVLKAVHRERDPVVVARTLEGAVLSELSRMRALTTESMTELREIKSSLLCLREVKLWTLGGVRDAVQSFMDTSSLEIPFSKIADSFEFADMEKISAVRHSLLRSPDLAVGIQGQTSPAVSHIKKICHLELSEAARNAGQLQIAVNATTLAQRLEDGSDLSAAVSSEFANVLWLEQEHSLAIKLLQQALGERSSAKASASKALRRGLHLSLLGEWTSISRTDNPERIRTTFFDSAVKLLEEQDQVAEFGVVYHRFANFAEQQYHALDTSQDVERLRFYKARNERELSEVASTGKPTRGRQVSQQEETTASANDADKIIKQRAQDVATLAAFDASKASYLEAAITMFARTLAISNEFDSTLVNRISSLWLSHFRDDALNSKIGPSLASIPSFKFVPLMFQLSGRLDAHEEGSSPFQTNLQELVVRLGIEHPFHSTYPLLSLRDSHMEKEHRAVKKKSTYSSSRKSLGSKGGTGVASSRGRAAGHVLERIVASGKLAASRVQLIEVYTEAAVEWCQFDTKHLSKGSSFNLEPSLTIGRIKDLAIPIPTIQLAVDPSAKYASFTSLQRFDTKFSIASGLHRPKIINCIGSDGREYKQLYKDEDDMRQDAIMEQLFEVVNTLLRHDPKTRSRSLAVRTYKILPLSPKTGVIEFVGNTTQLGTWLQKAHPRYRPKDISSLDFMAAMKPLSERSSRASPDVLKNKFASLQKKFQPVFRHYFTERHKDPMSWFTMRLNYARSVGTTSIVGHVVGLGDRHLANILLDQTTGEFVHIDFGIAFDQGRLLPIPELIPFRLTADVVDGLGISGVEGVFRRVCEETLRVLREKSSTIMTVLAVYRYDPLNKWVADEETLNRVQDGAGRAPAQPLPPTATAGRGREADVQSGIDEMADRVLSGVQEKLDTRLSISYTVNDLILQARDLYHLSSIYRGWQAQF